MYVVGVSLSAAAKVPCVCVASDAEGGQENLLAWKGRVKPKEKLAILVGPSSQNHPQCFRACCLVVPGQRQTLLLGHVGGSAGISLRC